MSVETRCLACYIPATLRCSGCKSDIFFCGKVHQKLLWPLHKLQCGHNPAIFRQPDLILEEYTIQKSKMASQPILGNHKEDFVGNWGLFHIQKDYTQWSNTLSDADRNEMLVIVRNEIHQKSNLPGNPTQLPLPTDKYSPIKSLIRPKNGLNSHIILACFQTFEIQIGEEVLRPFCNIFYAQMAVLLYLLLSSEEETSVDQGMISGAYERARRYINEVIKLKHEDLARVLLATLMATYTTLSARRKMLGGR